MNFTDRWQWLPTLVIVFVLGGMGVAKLVGTAGEVALFSQLGQEPVGRLFAGVVEVIACILVLSRLKWLGALLTLGVMAGAVVAHVTHIGFTSALTIALVAVTASAALLLYRARSALPIIGHRFRPDAASPPSPS